VQVLEGVRLQRVRRRLLDADGCSKLKEVILTGFEEVVALIAMDKKLK